MDLERWNCAEIDLPVREPTGGLSTEDQRAEDCRDALEPWVQAVMRGACLTRSSKGVARALLLQALLEIKRELGIGAVDEGIAKARFTARL